MLKPLTLLKLIHDLNQQHYDCYAVTEYQFKTLTAELHAYFQKHPYMRTHCDLVKKNEMRIHGVRICIATVMKPGHYDEARPGSDETRYTYYTHPTRSGKTKRAKSEFERFMRDGGMAGWVPSAKEHGDA